MRWEQDACPECGGPVWGVVNQVTALVRRNEETGIYDWEGTTDLDTQCDLLDESGREKLVCRDGHVWWSMPIADEDTVVCRLCFKLCRAGTAHLHQGVWIGEECCWDERLRSSE